jgi:hypothetical protein
MNLNNPCRHCLKRESYLEKTNLCFHCYLMDLPTKRFGKKAKREYFNTNTREGNLKNDKQNR